MTLCARNLSLTLRGRKILNDVSATFEAGKISAIVGANGAGKSSLLACLTGLRSPTAGQVLLNERPLSAFSANERARTIAYLPQQPEIAWDVDVAHLVGLGRLPWGDGDTPGGGQAIARALDRADLARFSGRKAQRLSGGEQGRVHLGRLLAGDARWLMLDEPFAALDPAHVLASARLLREEAMRGAAVIVVVHDLTLAAQVADHVLILKEGSVLAAGSPREVFTAARLSDAFATSIRVSDGADGLAISIDWRS